MGQVSFPHEWGTDMFRRRPKLVTSLLHRLLGDRVPVDLRMEITDASATPTNLAERQADCVVLFRRPDNTVAYAVVIEIQLGQSDEKPLRWPEYVVVTRSRHDCPTDLLVICTSDALARWAAKRIVLGYSGSVVVPIVVPPRMFPRVSDLTTAAEVPILVALSLAAHPDDEEVRAAVVTAERRLLKEDKTKAAVYHDFVLGLLSGPARAKLEDLMLSTEGYVYQSDFARNYFHQGEAKGRAEGEAKGRAEAVLMVLAAGGVVVGDDDRERIMACTDLKTLDRWLARARSATTVQELFA